MASRSVQVHFNNDTNYTLTLYKTQLSSGKWSQNDQPPKQIKPNQQDVQWGSQSDGFMTGTEGVATYQIDNTNLQVVIMWDNPYAGDNQYGAVIVPPFTSAKGWSCSHTGGSEDNANVTFTLNHSS